jgi:hypothetical protein
VYPVSWWLGLKSSDGGCLDDEVLPPEFIRHKKENE